MAHTIYFLAILLLSLYNVNAFIPVEVLSLLSKDLGFSWGNCGSGSDPLQFKSLSVSPDPIRVPGNITASFSVAITSALPTDLHSSTTLEKKVSGFWIKVPCEHNVGSCNYGNLCQTWATDCPKYFEKFGFPCNCPIPANTYTVNDALIDVTEKLPSQAEGEFKMSINIGGGSGQVGCLNLNFNLKN